MLARVNPELSSLEESGFKRRYEVRGVLGQGGMGEVRLCQDQRIGREVAMKIIRAERAAHADMRARFLREARVQGQLEHPAVVPVYDLGLDPEGEAYFTMKRVRGIGLDQVLEHLEQGDPEARQRYSRRRLLSAFSNVCLAVDFAHQHGVLHRDLKPANIMLGDFGEVYVLDWGVARITGTEEAGTEAGAVPASAIADVQQARKATSDAGQTVEGQVFGTPGYMAPEQARGRSSTLDGRADVYSLGAILFEILTHEPLHEVTKPMAMLLATVNGVETRPSVRRPEADVPPELEAICLQATALDPGDRFRSARDMHEAIERFLDGDRDLLLRRQMAQEALRTAEEATEKALGDAADAEQQRERALQAVGRALALDPAHPAAVGTLVRLLTTPPQNLPAEARAEQARIDQEMGELVRHRGGKLSLSLNLLMLPLVLWMGVRDTKGLGLLIGTMSAWLLFHAASGRFRLSPQLAARGALALMTLAFLFGSRMFGPLIMLPIMVLMSTSAFLNHPDRRMGRTAAVVGCLTLLCVTALEASGMLPRSYLFRDGMMCIRPQLVALPEVPTLLFLLLMSMTSIIGIASFGGSIRDAVSRMEGQLRIHSWQLSRLVPDLGKRLGNQGRPG